MKSAAIGALLLAVPSYAQMPSAKGVNFYSLESEFLAGQEIAANLVRALPVVHDPRIDDYLDHLTSELRRHADPRFAYSFTVYDDRAYSGPQWVSLEMPVDALRGAASEPIAIAGGPILVPLSLIAGAPDEASLVFQLSHAMAHVALRHPTKLATRQDIAALASLPLEQQAIRHGAIADIAIVSAVPVAMEAAFTAFARQFELAADLLATSIMAASGYDPAAAIPYLQAQPRQFVPAPGKLRDAHPPVAKRVATIQDAIGKLPPLDYDAETGAFDEIKAVAGAIH